MLCAACGFFLNHGCAADNSLGEMLFREKGIELNHFGASDGEELLRVEVLAASKHVGCHNRRHNLRTRPTSRPTIQMAGADRRSRMLRDCSLSSE
jgi:hypothetical protein